MAQQSSSDMVMVELIDGNLGDHLIAFQGESYGYRISGDQFMMKRAHAAVDRRVRIVGEMEKARALGVQVMPAPPPGETIKKVLMVDNAEQAGGEIVARGSIKEGVVNLSQLLGKGSVAQPAPELPNAGPPAYDFTQLWGINEKNGHAETLQRAGIRTLSGLELYGAEKLATLLGISLLTARHIMGDVLRVKQQGQKKKKATK